MRAVPVLSPGASFVGSAVGGYVTYSLWVAGLHSLAIANLAGHVLKTIAFWVERSAR